jgi:SAM-dependent methyltransferase
MALSAWVRRLRGRAPHLASVLGVGSAGVVQGSGGAVPSPLVHLLRCLDCRGALDEVSPQRLVCSRCSAAYPVDNGTPRMIRNASAHGVRNRTAESFAYEWERFGRLRPEWRKNFIDYLKPLDPEWLRGKRVLDVGTGSGRHARQAAELGAEVVAVDLGNAIDVARGNLPRGVLTVQADAEALPFAHGTFDLVMSIGVLHHLPDPAVGLRAISPYARPGGYVHVYLYWNPPWRWHRAVLRLVSLARKATVRLPHRLLHLLCYPLAAVLFLAIVLPYRELRRIERLRGVADLLPLKTYADYPFPVLVNDQFDRLSAPIEHRYSAGEVVDMLTSAGLVDPRVVQNHGWVGNGRRPGDRPTG